LFVGFLGALAVGWGVVQQTLHLSTAVVAAVVSDREPSSQGFGQAPIASNNPF
jgi:hypothetical protein